MSLAVALAGCAGSERLLLVPAIATSAETSALNADLLAFPAIAMDDQERLATEMPPLSLHIIASCADLADPCSPEDMLRLQLVSGDITSAVATLESLRSTSPSKPGFDPEMCVLDIYATAKLKESIDGVDFGEAYGEAFRQVFASLNDREASDATYWLESPAFVHDRNLRVALSRTGPRGVGFADALKLVRAYLAQRVSIQAQSFLPALIVAEKERRYEVFDDVLIRTPEGATLSAVVVRPRNGRVPMPAALLFTIYTDEAANLQIAETAAAHGYVGVVADARGKRLSPDNIEPYENEVDDTYAVIDWISRQPWSNGKVGMYGGSYSGFAAWAATKRSHPALKTIVTYAAAMPGLGLPMWNNVFLNANYGWGFYVSNNKTLDNVVYGDSDRWDALNRDWYASGRPYREIDQVDSTPNPLLQRWLDHPAYDAYWQAMIPYKQDYAKINMPVLSITGYYDDGQISALHYLTEHYQHNNDAEHYLVIGPYDHFGAQSRWKPRELRGYALDPVALFDTQDLTFQWLDHVLRNGQRPALLEDLINYQVMGANVWRHAPSLAAMNNETLRFYLSADPAEGNRYRLVRRQPGEPASVKAVVNLADRSVSRNDYYPSPILGKPASVTGLSFISEPFDEPLEVAGMFSGSLRVSINKRDFDFGAVLYEIMPDGRLFQLSYYLGRASFADDMSDRRLLTPGQVESIPIKRSLLVSRQLQKGSRLLIVLDVNLNEYHEINYGTGGEVSNESIADAGQPLEVIWHNGSYLEIPIRK